MLQPLHRVGMGVVVFLRGAKGLSGCGRCEVMWCRESGEGWGCIRASRKLEAITRCELERSAPSDSQRALPSLYLRPHQCCISCKPTARSLVDQHAAAVCRRHHRLPPSPSARRAFRTANAARARMAWWPGWVGTPLHSALQVEAGAAGNALLRSQTHLVRLPRLLSSPPAYIPRPSHS